MSRYIVDPTAPELADFAAVGWDDDLRTYFCEVFAEEREGPRLLHSSGFSPEDRTGDLAQFLRRVKPLAVITDDVAAALYIDQHGRDADEHAWPPGRVG